MKKVKITDVRKTVIKEIEDTENIFSEEINAIYGNYLSKYIVCEKACKKILYKYYRYTKGTTIPMKEIELKYSDIVNAFKLYKYDIENNIISALFTNQKKIGNKSAKILRNEIVHDPKMVTIQEIMNRKDELYKKMELFLEKIKTKCEKKNGK